VSRAILSCDRREIKELHAMIIVIASLCSSKGDLLFLVSSDREIGKKSSVSREAIVADDLSRKGEVSTRFRQHPVSTLYQYFTSSLVGLIYGSQTTSVHVSEFLGAIAERSLDSRSLTDDPISYPVHGIGDPRSRLPTRVRSRVSLRPRGREFGAPANPLPVSIHHRTRASFSRFSSAVPCGSPLASSLDLDVSRRRDRAVLRPCIRVYLPIISRRDSSLPSPSNEMYPQRHTCRGRFSLASPSPSPPSLTPALTLVPSFVLTSRAVCLRKRRQWTRGSDRDASRRSCGLRR